MTQKYLLDLYAGKCELILEWADEEDREFDTEFVENILAYIEKYDEISPDQMSSIDNIISKFKIPE